MPSIIDLDPQAGNLAFLENPISRSETSAKLPFDAVKNELSRPNLVEFHGGLFIYNGNRRICAVRFLDPMPPPTIRVNLFTIDEFALFLGYSRQQVLRHLGRATKTPTLGP